MPGSGNTGETVAGPILPGRQPERVQPLEVWLAVDPDGFPLVIALRR